METPSISTTRARASTGGVIRSRRAEKHKKTADSMTRTISSPVRLMVEAEHRQTARKNRADNRKGTVAFQMGWGDSALGRLAPQPSGFFLTFLTSDKPSPRVAG